MKQIKNLAIPFLFIISLLMSHCSMQQNDEELENLIPREKMVVILADIQVAEAYLEDLKKSGFKVKDSSIFYYEQVFKKNKVTPISFEESLLYYKRNMDELEGMYTDVITRLNQLKAKNEEILLQMKADSIYQDSIRRVEIIQDSIIQLIADSVYKDSLRRVEIIHDSIIPLNDSIFAD